VQSQEQFVKQPERQIPVYKKVDVVVAGGGPGGLGAAIAAARNGANTLLVERYSFLGGMATAAMQSWFGGPYDIPNGISKEVLQKLDKVGAARYIERGRFQPAATGLPPLTYHVSFDPESYKYLVLDMVHEAGAKVLTNTWVVDTIVEDNTVKGIIIENKSGRQAILADVVIDGTGDADVAARAGAPIDKLPASGYLMSMIMCFRVAGINYKKIAEYAREHPEDFKSGGGVPPDDFDGTNLASIQGNIWGWFSFVKQAKKTGLLPPDFRCGWGGDEFSVVGISPYSIKHGVGYFDMMHEWKRFPWNAEDVCQAEANTRERIRIFVNFLMTVPGFEDSFLIDIAPSIGLQDSRRIVGEYMLTRKDEYEGKTFNDDVALLSNIWPDLPVNEYDGWMKHPADGSQGDEKYKSKLKGSALFQVVFGFPYRCLIPKGYDGILVAGQTVGMTYMAHEPGTCRNMTTCMNFGQAAGTAASMASKLGISPRKVDIPTLKKTLESQGVILKKEAVDMSEVRKMVEARGDRIGHVA
jgi:ribulose 1,5-bisphosphate synthetase/thiazole synthase